MSERKMWRGLEMGLWRRRRGGEGRGGRCREEKRGIEVGLGIEEK